MTIARRSQSQASLATSVYSHIILARERLIAHFDLVATETTEPGRSSTKKASVAPQKPAEQKRRVKAETSVKLREKRRRPNITDAMVRKALLEEDPWTDNVHETSVHCLGCNQTIRLDCRNRQYYVSNWTKHRRNCRVIKAAEARAAQRLAGPAAPASQCTTPEMQSEELYETYDAYTQQYQLPRWLESNPYDDELRKRESPTAPSPIILRQGPPEASPFSVIPEAQPGVSTGAPMYQADDGRDRLTDAYYDTRLSAFTEAECHAILVLAWGKQQRLPEVSTMAENRLGRQRDGVERNEFC
ncbi:hypothetical protein LshimejAT787_1300200 [Lyophyllum shimeji]|uniref:Uncharacterized protein n=1 Tax=Lyophyllum shimeji TaxID=47721 RepID=A0A9P3UPS7_LYOSH|nr:hypothetical protein LshimejAT787_1300200 [Lyophyllum shimeji]